MVVWLFFLIFIYKKKDKIMNEAEKKEELERLMQKAKDFWSTPFEELIEQGYGVIEDPEE